MKIKSIHIKNFRVYNLEQDFNFCNQDKIADFVVIYAPNGFGKTSFIDAIEWSFTDRIERFNNNANIRSLLDNEKRVSREKEGKLCILRNVNNPEENAHVKIVSDTGKILEVESKEIKGIRRCDYTINLKSNNVNREFITKDVSFNSIKENEFKINNLITSDMVNSFLQLDNPTERFKILHKFWDKEDEYDFYVQILALNKELIDKCKSIQQDIKSQNGELKKYKLNNDKLNMFNDLINKFNLYNKQAKIILVEKDKSSQYDVQQFSNIKIEKQKSKDILDNKLSKLQLLLSENDTYNTYIINLENIKKNNENIKNLQRKFNEYNRINKQIEEYKIEVRVIKARCNNYQYIINNTDIYLRKINENNELKSEIDKLQKNNDIKISNKKEILESLKALKSDYKLKENECVKSNQDYALAKDQYKRHSNNRNIINYIRKVNSTFSNTQRKYRNSINMSCEYIKELNIIRSNLVEKCFPESTKRCSFSYKISEIIKQSNILIKNYKDNIDEIASIEKNNEHIQNRKDEIINLIKLSFPLMEEGITDRCPLCNSKFDDYVELKKSILSNLNNAAIERSLEESIKNRSDLLKKNEEIDKSIFDLINKIDEIKKNYTVMSENLSMNENRIKSRQRIIGKKLRDKLSQQDEIENILKNICIDNSVDIAENIEVVLEEKIKFNLKGLGKLYDEIGCLDRKLEETGNKIQELLLKIQEKNNKIATNNNILEISNIKELLKKYGLNLNNFSDKVTINNDLNTEIEKMSKINLEISRYEGKITAYKLELFGCSKEQIERELEKINRNVQIKEEYVSRYKNTYSLSLKDAHNIDTELIVKEIECLTLKKNESEEELALLSSIISFIDIIKECKEELILKNKITELNDEYSRIIKKTSEIEEIKKECEKYLDSKIRQAFNLKAINSIYQMIDPHPDLENIKFIPEFTNKETKIHIHAFNENKELAPILYFSSAQVSILALSIFYAQILKNASNLDTIFMDDPIQHLDSINTLAFIDLMRSMITQPELNKQIVLTTNNSEFYELLKLKLNPEYYNSKFIVLESYGEISQC